ncbi:hypothetical protein CEXT_188031 [Caerostris extrusa]|uniref:Uncharacterized protein n=1 Tax=Caerostris extrusa TaxID=172846 RepID=A0AAV4UM41_CAEEX|nr:hypothetical protein CEXT_188031 [Caerostris extrusa]
MPGAFFCFKRFDKGEDFVSSDSIGGISDWSVGGVKKIISFDGNNVGRIVDELRFRRLIECVVEGICKVCYSGVCVASVVNFADWKWGVLKVEVKVIPVCGVKLRSGAWRAVDIEFNYDRKVIGA